MGIWNIFFVTWFLLALIREFEPTINNNNNNNNNSNDNINSNNNNNNTYQQLLFTAFWKAILQDCQNIREIPVKQFIFSVIAG